MGRFINLANKRFGRLLVIRKAGKNKWGELTWITRCSCGRESEMVGNNLRRRQSRSCGYCGPRPHKNNDGWSARTTWKTAYINGARRRNLEWRLTDEEFDALTQARCHYCNALPSLWKRTGRWRFTGGFSFNGIDRKDSQKGYVPDNVVSCCSMCNRMKGDISYQDFMDWIERIGIKAGGFRLFPIVGIN